MVVIFMRCRKIRHMQRRAGFTLIEIAIAVFILMVLLLLAIPSVTGVLANRRLQRSLDAMNKIVRMAQEHSVQEHRPYLIEWEKNSVILRPETSAENDPEAPTAALALDKGHAYVLWLPAALEKDPLPQWIFWPSGACEPANVRFKGPDGTWEVNYSPLTARPQIVRYAAR
jgi:type II secretory pathway pseudopilin PulG